MKKIKCVLTLSFFIVQYTTLATTNLDYKHINPMFVSSFSDSNLNTLLHLSVKQIEQLAGRKLQFKEKIALKFYKKNPNFFNNVTDSTETTKQEKKALWAKRLGVGSLIGLLVPFINIFSFPAAIVAIVLGISTRDKTKSNKNSDQGILFGSITIVLLLLLVGLVLLITTLGRAR